MEKEEIIEEKKEVPEYLQHKGVLKYNNPEVVDFILDARTQENPATWKAIAEHLRKNGYEQITPVQCKKVYTSAITKTVTMTKRGGKQFTDYTDKLNDMYSQYIEVLQRWINAADNLTRELENNSTGDVEPLQASIMIMKLSPQMKQVQEEIRLAMEFNRKQQEMIKIEQKNAIYSEDDIRKKLFEQLERMEKEGRIIWKKG